MKYTSADDPLKSFVLFRQRSTLHLVPPRLYRMTFGLFRQLICRLSIHHVPTPVFVLWSLYSSIHTVHHP